MPNTKLSIAQAHQYAAQLQKNGQICEAMSIYQQIIQALPKNTTAALELARLLNSQGELAQARSVLVSRSNFAQDDFEYNYMLSALSLKTHKLDSALNFGEKCAAIQPESVHAHNLLGTILLESQKYDNAIESFQKAIELDAEFVDAHNNIAWCYRALGNKAKALEHFAEAYRLDATATEALSGQLMLRKFSKTEPEMEEAEARLQDTSLSDTATSELHFSLGKAFEDCKNFDKASQHFLKGNEIWRRNTNYSISLDQELFESIRSANYKIAETQDNRPSASEPKPIFVLGLPRSSTSLVEQILASHSKVFGAGELPHIGDLCLPNGRFSFKLENAIKFSKDYIKRIETLDCGKAFVVDKMPQNFRFVGAILSSIPNAKIIHCRRDARDNCLSLFKHHFPMAQHSYAYSSNEIKQYYGLYSELMAYWDSLFPEKIYHLNYETLLSDFEPSVRGLLQYCGLDFETQCLKFEETKRAIRTASSDQVRRGLYQSGSRQWENYQDTLAELFEGLNSNGLTG